ncbi:hypothetical protein [Parasediminibacterium sp. JCM 36343]|uniref:hypothetical protein n=1 Tax=Parasediminibacterium sp. JCM 36343 TaxID=3374279 RepID=UPI00397C64FE
MQNFSQEQLIQYLYGECSPILKLAIDTAKKEDIELQQEIKTLKRAMKQINNLKLQSPSQSTIDSILQYASKTQKKDT